MTVPKLLKSIKIWPPNIGVAKEGAGEGGAGAPPELKGCAPEYQTNLLSLWAVDPDVTRILH